MTTRTQSQQTKEEIKPWIRRFGRFGYMAKGTVYGLVGILAFMAAIGVGGKTTGTSGMLRTLAGVKFGEILLWLVGIGLIGYVIWGFIKAIKNPQNKGAISRIGYAVSGVIYGALAFKALKIAMHAGSGSKSEESLSAQLLSQPFGQWILGAIGIIIIGYGLYELFTGWSERFMKQFKTGQMDPHEQKIACKSGKMGLMSRGVVLGLIGFFFVQTAVNSNPDQAKGLDGALSELAQTPYGQWVLGVVALGLILYGVYQIIRGRHEHMSFGKIK
ncbi:DUF1206 domain-containing protein [Halobacillus massiliensis]|uniref:DUF1206 domain-containing protein n=1 Tax=Halobacillus massiliensis TaxID=1926286 RepID=UPI0009E3DE11|nr:DUF1206 domain-containing protein [Halobacillus massiliensis]